MKKMHLLLLLFFIFTSTASFSYASCSSTGFIVEYAVMAKIDGIQHVYSSGLSGVSEKAFGELYESSGGGLVILATEFTIDDIFTASNCFYFEIDSMSTSPASYTLLDFKICFINLEGVQWPFYDISFHVTQFDDVGGVMKGTFTGTIWDGFNISTTKSVTDGSFEVLRIPDSSF